MSRSLEKVKGVEYKIHRVTVDAREGKEALLPMPQKVDGLPLESFLLLDYSKTLPNPKLEHIALLALDSAYDSHCFRYLLRRRKFNLMSLSPRHNPFFEKNPLFKGLREMSHPEPTGNEVLNSVFRLLAWGKSSESTEDLFHRALYVHPEWFPTAYSKENPLEFIQKLQEDFLLESNKEFLETVEPMEKFFKSFTARHWGIILYVVEDFLFSIYGVGMQKVYERIQSELTLPQQNIFKWFHFRNPAYFNRILIFDRSPVLSGYAEMQLKISGALRNDKSQEGFTLEAWENIWRAYLAFYPHWTWSEREREKEYERETRKKVRSVPFEDWSAKYPENGKKRSYQVKEIPEYMVDPQFRALVEAGYRYDEPTSRPSTSELAKAKKAPRAKRAKTVPREIFLSTTEKKVISLADRGVRQKDIAKKFGYSSASGVSKKLKSAQELVKLAWENVYQDTLRKARRYVRKRRGPTSQKDSPDLYQMVQNLIGALTKEMPPGTYPDPKRVERDILRLFRPK